MGIYICIEARFLTLYKSLDIVLFHFITKITEERIFCGPKLLIRTTNCWYERNCILCNNSNIKGNLFYYLLVICKNENKHEPQRTWINSDKWWEFAIIRTNGQGLQYYSTKHASSFPNRTQTLYDRYMTISDNHKYMVIQIWPLCFCKRIVNECIMVGTMTWKSKHQVVKERRVILFGSGSQLIHHSTYKS